MNAKEARENTFKFRHTLQNKIPKSPIILTFKGLRNHLLFQIDRATKDGEFQIEHYVDTSIDKIHPDTLSSIIYSFMDKGYDIDIKRSFLEEVLDFIFTLRFHKVFRITIKW
jgi:hypothetical protein